MSAKAGDSSAMRGSSSAPTLANSPYAQVLGTKTPSQKPARRKVWAPPPGAFNNPDLPRFDGPGPGRYSVNDNLTKKRVTGPRFGSEDRFKNLGGCTEMTSTGMVGMYNPQSMVSPGPSYMPSYSAVHSQSRISAFSTARRDTTGAPGGSATNPGPGLYTPTDTALSTKHNYTAGGAFLADDRHKYLGQVDPASGLKLKSFSPGPVYNPPVGAGRASAPTVAFGGTGPGSIKKPPSLRADEPGPGAYDHAMTMAEGSVLSSKHRAPAPGFGSTTRGEASMQDSSQCFHGKVPVDMTNAKNTSITPGPAYNPSWSGISANGKMPVFGTSKRVTQAQGIAKWQMSGYVK